MILLTHAECPPVSSKSLKKLSEEVKLTYNKI